MNQTNPDHLRILRMPIRAFMTIADFEIRCAASDQAVGVAEADLGMTAPVHVVDEDMSIQTMTYGMGSPDDRGMRTIHDMEFYVRADPDLPIGDIERRLRERFGDRVVRVATQLFDHELHDWKIVRQDEETRLRGYVEDATTKVRTPVTTAVVDPEDRYDEYRIVRAGTDRYRLGDKAEEPVPAPSLTIPSDVLRAMAEKHPDAIGNIILAIGYDHATRSIRPHMTPGAAVPDHVRRDMEPEWTEGRPSVTACEAPDRSFRIVLLDIQEGMIDCYVILPDGPTLRSADAGYEAFRVLARD